MSHLVDDLVLVDDWETWLLDWALHVADALELDVDVLVDTQAWIDGHLLVLGLECAAGAGALSLDNILNVGPAGHVLWHLPVLAGKPQVLVLALFGLVLDGAALVCDFH